MNKKVLFILHDDSKSGAPYLIYSFIKYLKDNVSWDFDVLILNLKNELYFDLKLLTVNVILSPFTQEKIIHKIIKKFHGQLLYKRWIHNLIRRNRYNVIYGNTVATLSVLSEIKRKFNHINAILHVHESEYLCQLILGKKNAIDDFKFIDNIICVSNFSANNLISNYEVISSKINIIYPFFSQGISRIKSKQIAKKELGLPDNAIICSNLCYPHLTKGTDLLPQIVKRLINLLPDLNIIVLSIGSREENEYTKSIMMDIKKLGIENRLKLIKHTDSPQDYLFASDIYLIPSREDSFTLVGIEAATLGIPIVSFNNAGGLHEVIKGDGFIEVDYLNVDAFAKAIVNFINNAMSVENVGRIKFEELDHFSQLEKLRNIIEEINLDKK